MLQTEQAGSPRNEKRRGRSPFEEEKLFLMLATSVPLTYEQLGWCCRGSWTGKS